MELKPVDANKHGAWPFLSSKKLDFKHVPQNRVVIEGVQKVAAIDIIVLYIYI